MRHRLHLSALLATSLLTASSAFAQNTGAAGAGEVAPGMGGVPPVGTTTTNPGSVGISSAPGGTSTTGTGTTGMGAGSTTGLSQPQPAAPNPTSPGRIGTGATPSGLLGDDPAHPGFFPEGSVGKH